MLIDENITICCVEPLHHLKEQGKVGVVGLLNVELLSSPATLGEKLHFCE